MKQNEFLVSKVREDSQKEQETRAQNEYLRKQLGSFLKQKQRMNEETYNLNQGCMNKSKAMMWDHQVKKRHLGDLEGNPEINTLPMI